MFVKDLPTAWIEIFRPVQGEGLVHDAFPIDRDDDLLDEIVETCLKFWTDHVEKEDPPLEWASGQQLGELWTPDPDKTAEVDYEVAKKLHSVKQQLKELKAQETELGRNSKPK